VLQSEAVVVCLAAWLPLIAEFPMDSASLSDRQLLGTLGRGYYHRPCTQRFACVGAITIAVGVVLLFLVLCAVYCICCPGYFRCCTIHVLHVTCLQVWRRQPLCSV
jgi:hypothetical protein